MEYKNQKYSQSIINGFIALLETKPYDKVTIKEICDVTKVSRQTFYNHYKTKDDVFKEVYFQILEEKCQLNNAPLEYFISDKFIYRLIESYDEYSSMLLVLNKWHLTGYFGKDVINHFNVITSGIDDEYVKEYSDYFLCFIFEPVCSICLNWIQKGKPETKAELFQIIKHFIEVRSKN